jgi:hypothetical protein
LCIKTNLAAVGSCSLTERPTVDFPHPIADKPRVSAPFYGERHVIDGANTSSLLPREILEEMAKQLALSIHLCGSANAIHFLNLRERNGLRACLFVEQQTSHFYRVFNLVQFDRML